MSDPRIQADLIDQMIEASEKIIRRAKNVVQAEDFLATPEGEDARDGIVLMIIVLGEAAKKLDKIGPLGFLDRYPEVEWKGLKGMRDVLSHEYYMLEPSVVFDVSKTKIPKLLEVLLRMKQELA